MLIRQVEKSDMRGIYRIEDAYPEKNKHREGRYVVFPYEATEGFNTSWFYVSWDGKEHDYIGKMCRTSTVKAIQITTLDSGYDSIQISTNNSQYVFTKLT